MIKATIAITFAVICCGSLVQAGPQCSDLFSDQSRVGVQSIVTQNAKLDHLGVMVSAGMSPVVAARVVEFYPELASKILKKIENNDLEMITLYRGVSVEVKDHDPYHIRFIPGGNLIAPPFRVGVNNGIFASTNLATALAYTSGLMYGKSFTGKGVVFELQVPKFLVSQHWLSKDYFYIPRSNTPELDLWVSRYAHADLYDITKPHEVETKLTGYEDYYLTQKRQDLVAKNKFAEYAMRLFNLIGRLKAKF